MASNSLPIPVDSASDRASTHRAMGSFSLKQTLIAILTPLASLKLTVFLLVAATVVTWIATLDQTRADIWQVKNKHFQNVLVEVPFQTLFVPRWFPDQQNVQGSFYVPSGVTLLIVMLVNLIAAHMLRYRLQAKGLKLIVGLIAAAAAAALTWAVVFNGQNADGFQAQPPISWALMWRMLQVGMLGIGIAAAYAAATIEPSRTTERIMLVFGAVVTLIALAITLFLNVDAFIGDSGMRILWQLIQASIAGTAALAAAMVLFKRKAGIVIVHLGIAGLMANELYVTATNEEQRMVIREGETVSTAMDIRGVELVAVDMSDPTVDHIVTVPGERLEAGGWIADEQLPFQIRCDKYLRNAQIIRAMGGGSNDATDGLGTTWLATPVAAGIGTASEQAADMAAVYVSLKSKDGANPLGTYMVAQAAWETGLVDTIEADGKDWRIGLRFKTAYKPYSLTLNDVQAEYYLSTSTPRWFASEITLNDSRTGTESDQRIWMNNPLRYADETFYQSSYQKEENGTEYTVLQVVRNKGWMIPYVCCMFTVIGLVAQFGSSLMTHLEKQRKKSLAAGRTTSKAIAASQESLPVASKPKNRWLPKIPAIALTLFFGLYAVGEFAKATRGKATETGFQLDKFGSIPVSFNGRVQPLDSVARNTARQLGNRETVVDANGDQQPAIQWLADTVFEKPGFQDYRVFRIEAPTVRSALGLSEDGHDRFLYSLDDLKTADQTIMKAVENSVEKLPNMDQWPPFHKRLWEVKNKLQSVMAIRVAFGSPTQRVGDDVASRLGYGKTIVEAKGLPLAVPVADETRPWISFAESLNRSWVREKAKALNVTTSAELAEKITQQEVLGPLRKDMIKQQVIQRLVADEDIVKMLAGSSGETDPRKLAEILRRNWDDFPKETYAGIAENLGPMVDAMLLPRAERVQQAMLVQLEKILGNEGFTTTTTGDYPAVEAKLESAYVNGQADEFNASLDNYLAAVAAKPPTEMNVRGVKWEYLYNGFSPFYLAIVVYLVAFVIAALGWLFWMQPLQKAATWLILLGVSLQIIGLVMRVVISGRPPVTNLYSSALFVSAAYVLLMLIVERVTRIGIGNAMASAGGCLALLWAWSMSISDGDTFAVLVAVLDTQFWLSTHVIIISLGYSATLAAGLLGVAYVVCGVVTPAMDKDNRKLFGGLIYGLVCFGLLASFFGTVLGGLWGDDSWGRFWGWDPKENGALMIVLWNAVLLHARWGGMVKTRGLAALSIIGCVVTIWSWKGVNSMGVGLHAYAASEDATVFWILMFVAGLGAALLLAMIPTRFWISKA